MRDGGIAGLRHKDGTPPYDVRRPDTQAVTLVCPGPDTRILSGSSPRTGRCRVRGAPDRGVRARHGRGGRGGSQSSQRLRLTRGSRAQVLPRPQVVPAPAAARAIRATA
ncbi:DUF1918 domain-containing protein [Streptomyces sp. KMM 9044]|uniref:DUF1918 domain-containing protein n=1 Tax=Streptomyces sp. KMM 9044 TaxID=2744474 RepID=UPI003FA71C4F